MVVDNECTTMAVLQCMCRLPAAQLPALDRLPEVAIDSIGIAFVVFVVGISMSKTYATKHGYSIDPNQVPFGC